MVQPSPDPLVSVVIPCYRQGRYLKTAVDSCLGQSYPAVEVVVVNDGSDDETEDEARRYGSRIVYIHRPNGGQSAARNTGIAAATGAYLKFLDADDHLHPDQVAWQVAALGGRTDRISLTGVRLYRDGAPDEYEDHIPVARNLIPDLFRDIDWGAPCGFLFPATLVRAVVGFNESLRFHEDWDFFCRLGLLGPELVTDSRVGAYYRQRPGSISANRVGVTTTLARRLIELHDTIRSGSRPEWFGPELLRAEQGTYRNLLRLKVGDPELLKPLLSRITELQGRLGYGTIDGRFRYLARLIGFGPAERVRIIMLRLAGLAPAKGEAWPTDPVRAGVLRLLGLRPRAPSLDIAPWREGK